MLGERANVIGRWQPRIDLGRWYRPLAVGLTLLALAWGVMICWTIAHDPAFGDPGGDRATYMAATQRWLATGHFYDPRQLSGPYAIWDQAILYPPIALLLFVPLSVLPAVVWWAVPVLVVAGVVVWHRPAPWGWPLIALCLCWHTTLDIIYVGNPVLWIAAGVALGTVYGWPALAVAMKPTLAPFVLVGIRRRSWWVCATILALIALAFGTMWIDWWHAATDIYGWRVGPLYSAADVPLLLAPVVAWASRRS